MIQLRRLCFKECKHLGSQSSVGAFLLNQGNVVGRMLGLRLQTLRRNGFLFKCCVEYSL